MKIKLHNTNLFLCTVFIYVKEIREYILVIMQFQIRNFVLNENKLVKERAW